MPTFAAQDVADSLTQNLIAMKKLILSFGILMLALLPKLARSQENPEYTGTVPPPMPHEFLNVELARSMYHAQANGCCYGVTEAALSTRLIWPMQVEVRTVLSDGFLASKGAIRVWGVMAGPRLCPAAQYATSLPTERVLRVEVGVLLPLLLPELRRRLHECDAQWGE